jgi:hypothetical protein
MAKRRKQDAPEAEEIVGPAKQHEGHVQHVLAGGQRGWKNIAEHPLTYAFEKGQLTRGSTRYSADDRYRAGTLYRALCETLARSGRDCLDLELISRPTGFQISDAKANAMHILARIDSQLKSSDRKIVRRVCADGLWPNAAVREACGHDLYEKTAVPRFVEALDELIEAMQAARRREDAATNGLSRGPEEAC